jgi:hypothetical protein
MRKHAAQSHGPMCRGAEIATLGYYIGRLPVPGGGHLAIVYGPHSMGNVFPGGTCPRHFPQHVAVPIIFIGSRSNLLDFERTLFKRITRELRRVIPDYSFRDSHLRYVRSNRRKLIVVTGKNRSSAVDMRYPMTIAPTISLVTGRSTAFSAAGSAHIHKDGWQIQQYLTPIPVRTHHGASLRLRLGFQHELGLTGT